MSNVNRKRDILVRFWVTPAELDMIKNRMKQIPTDNRGAYLRKMAIALLTYRRTGRGSISLLLSRRDTTSA